MRAMVLSDYFTFASEAAIIGLWGAGFVALALFATLAENRRSKRARIEQVGWVPWRAIFLASAMIGAGLIALAVKGMLAG